MTWVVIVRDRMPNAEDVDRVIGKLVFDQAEESPGYKYWVALKHLRDDCPSHWSAAFLNMYGAKPVLWVVYDLAGDIPQLAELSLWEGGRWVKEDDRDS